MVTQPPYDKSGIREDILDFIANRPSWFDVKRGSEYGNNLLKEYDALVNTHDELVAALESMIDFGRDVINGNYEYGDKRFPEAAQTLTRAKDGQK